MRVLATSSLTEEPVCTPLCMEGLSGSCGDYRVLVGETKLGIRLCAVEFRDWIRVCR